MGGVHQTLQSKCFAFSFLFPFQDQEQVPIWSENKKAPFGALQVLWSRGDSNPCPNIKPNPLSTCLAFIVVGHNRVKCHPDYIPSPFDFRPGIGTLPGLSCQNDPPIEVTGRKNFPGRIHSVNPRLGCKRIGVIAV
jgi:hypothetical protein